MYIRLNVLFFLGLQYISTITINFVYWSLNKKLSYRKQITRQQHTQFSSWGNFSSIGSMWDTIGDTRSQKHKFQGRIVFHGQETLMTPLVFDASKSCKNHILRLYSMPPWGDPVGILQRCLVLRKLDWLGCHMLQKVWWYVTPLRYNTEAWQTDGQTVGKNCYISVVCQTY